MAFVMEQHVGHQTFYQNLRTFVDGNPHVRSTWVPVTYRPTSDRWTWHHLLPAGIRGTFDGQTEVRQALRQDAYDVVFFNTQVPAVLGEPFTRRFPYVVSTDITPVQYDAMATLYHHHPDRPGPVKWLKHRANAQTLRKADLVLPWTQWARDSLENDYGVSPKQMTVLPAGVDTGFWTLKPAFNQGERIKLLFVGGDFMRKGGDLLLHVFQALPPGLAELHIVTHSEVPDADNIHVYHDRQPNTAELLALYHNADIFVLPTGADAFGFVLIEAMACGLPVITTCVGGVQEVVSENETGFLVQPGDIAGLRERILRLIVNRQLIQQMGTAAHERVQTHFNAQTQTAKIVTLLRRVAGNHGRLIGGAA